MAKDYEELCKDLAAKLSKQLVDTGYKPIKWFKPEDTTYFSVNPVSREEFNALKAEISALKREINALKAAQPLFPQPYTPVQPCWTTPSWKPNGPWYIGDPPYPQQTWITTTLDCSKATSLPSVWGVSPKDELAPFRLSTITNPIVRLEGDHQSG